MSYIRNIGTVLGVMLAVGGTASAQDIQPAQPIIQPELSTTMTASSFKYNLATGANSKPIKLPANVPIQLIGANLTPGFRGVGQASLLHITGSFIEWVGLETTSGAAITEGFSGTAGTHILFIDFSHQVDIQVAGPDTIFIHNGSTGQRNGTVTISY